MNSSKLLKVSFSINIADQLNALPEYKDKTITSIVRELLNDKLKNNANERNENQHENTTNTNI